MLFRSEGGMPMKRGVWNEDQEDFLVSVDDGVHTAICPYCGNLECWCHTDVEYHDIVTHPAATDEDVEQAYGFYRIPR